MNNNLKPTLWAIFAALVMMIWFKWDEANRPQPVAQSPTSQEAPASITGSGNTETLATEEIPGSEIANIEGRSIHVKTDVLELVIDTTGGSIIESQLLNYSTSIEDKTPIKLFSSEEGKLFQFKTGLYAKTHKNSPTHLAKFTSPQENYILTGDSISVPLTWQDDGVSITKTFTFYRGRYDFEIKQHVENKSHQAWTGMQYSYLLQDEVSVKRGLTTFNTFAGGAYSKPDKKYGKADFEELAKGEMNFKEVKGGWVSLMQHYFMGAIIPNQDSVNSFESQRLPHSNRYKISVQGQYKTIPPQANHTFTNTGFVGPKIKDELASIAPNLDRATDYGKLLFFISDFLFDILDWVHSIIKNWGWAIVIVTIGIKTLLFPLAAKSFKSMAKMRKFQPEMERIRENYGENRQLQGQKMMELYKKEGINPASGCLPILVQIPIFLAFYYMLMESVELRQAPWIFWIKDLSIKDPFYVLPVINMGLMFLQQRLNPPPSDPIQRKVMMFMPLMFGFLFLVFPAGLVLYWSISNLFSIVQQYVITKRYSGLENPLSHSEDKHYHPKQ